MFTGLSSIKELNPTILFWRPFTSKYKSRSMTKMSIVTNIIRFLCKWNAYILKPDILKCTERNYDTVIDDGSSSIICSYKRYCRLSGYKIHL